MKTRDARSLPSIAQQDIRLKAIKAFKSGKTQVEVAKIFGVTRHAVGKWVKAYRQGGEKALKAKKKGRPRGGSLLPWQSAQIAKAVVDRCPDQMKLPFYLWTREAVAQLIERKFEIQLSVWTVGRYLKRWGFTPQKPLRRAYEKNPEAVHYWLNVQYPSIRKQAKREKAIIYWGDEMGLRSDHSAGRSYGRCGQTPVIPGTGQRFSCNMISAITNNGQLNYMVFKETFNADVFLDFLKRLVRQSPKKVFLVVDGHPAHRAGKVKDWLDQKPLDIRLFFLPGYSPELNPDEMLNQDVKSNAVGRKRPHNLAQMIRTVRQFLRGRQRRPHIIKKYFHEKDVRYAAI